MSTKRTKLPTLTVSTEQAGEGGEIIEYLEGLRGGAAGEFGQYALAQAFPRGFRVYPAIDQLRTAERLRLWIADPNSQVRRAYDKEHGTAAELTAAQTAKDYRDLFGG